MSGFSKVIVSGKLGSVEVSEDGGVASLKGTVSAELGGGDVKGYIKVHNSTQIDLEVLELINVGFDLAAAKFPSVAAGIQLAKAAVDAEVAKLNGAPPSA